MKGRNEHLRVRCCQLGILQARQGISDLIVNAWDMEDSEVKPLIKNSISNLNHIQLNAGNAESELNSCTVLTLSVNTARCCPLERCGAASRIAEQTQRASR